MTKYPIYLSYKYYGQGSVLVLALLESYKNETNISMPLKSLRG